MLYDKYVNNRKDFETKLAEDELTNLSRQVESKAEAIRRKNPGTDIGIDAVSFTRRELREYSGWTGTRLHIHLSSLVDLEYVTIRKTARSNLKQYGMVQEAL